MKVSSIHPVIMSLHKPPLLTEPTRKASCTYVRPFLAPVRRSPRKMNKQRRKRIFAFFETGSSTPTLQATTDKTSTLHIEKKGLEGRKGGCHYCCVSLPTVGAWPNSIESKKRGSLFCYPCTMVRGNRMRNVSAWVTDKSNKRVMDYLFSSSKFDWVKVV